MIFNAATQDQLELKADKTDVSSPYKFKGNCTYANLPSSGNVVNDTYYVTDQKCKYTWNGKNWYQSSLNESDYEDDFNEFKTEVNTTVNTFETEVNTELSDLKADLTKLDNGVINLAKKYDFQWFDNESIAFDNPTTYSQTGYCFGRFENQFESGKTYCLNLKEVHIHYFGENSDNGGQLVNCHDYGYNTDNTFTIPANTTVVTITIPMKKKMELRIFSGDTLPPIETSDDKIIFDLMSIVNDINSSVELSVPSVINLSKCYREDNTLYYYESGQKYTQQIQSSIWVKNIYENIKYIFEYSNAHITFYNSENPSTSTYISGLVTNYQNWENDFTVPQNTKLIIITTSTANVNSYLELEYSDNSTEKITVGSNNCTYTSILDALISEGKNAKLYLAGETFNIQSEYKAKYGNAYFDNYNGYISSSNIFDAGLMLLDGVEIYGTMGTKILFDYDGSNTKVHEEFAPINMTANNVLDNVTIEIGDRNCRYHIHDDFSHLSSGTTNVYSKGKNIISNCTLIGTAHNGYAIGGGFGYHMEYEIINNVILSDTSISIYYHNANVGNALNRIVINNNYCKKGISLAWYGNSQLISNALVSNNSATSVECKAIVGYDAPYENIKMYAWNNEIRSN